MSIEQLVPTHAADAFVVLREPGLYRFIPMDPPASVDALERQFLRFSNGAPPDSGEVWLNWAIRRLDTDEIAGTVQVSIEADGWAYVAYFLGTQHQGGGLATEAVALAIDEVSAQHRPVGFAALIDTRNERSCALVERLGFRRVGLIRDADHFDGAPSHEYRYERGA